MDNLTFGRYSPYNTVVHKLDPRNKIFLMILFMVGIFFQFKLWSVNLIMSGVYLIILIIIMLLSRVSFVQLFKSLGSMWLMVVFLLLIYIFIPTTTHKIEPEAFKIFNYAVYWDSFCRAGYIVLRLVMMLSLTMILTSTTKPMDMTYAFEWYMTPLKVIRFPVHEIAMTISIALRFIPTLLNETERIMKAQASRGVDFNRGGLGKRFKAVISLIIPLFVSAIQRSEELSDAMEARGYDPRAKRTRYRKLRFSWRDIIAFLLGAAVFGGILYLFIIDHTAEPVRLFEMVFQFDPGF